MNKTLTIGIIAIAVLLAGIVGFWMMSQNMLKLNPGQYTFSNTGNNKTDQGTVVVAITDAAANMGNVSAVNVTVDKVYLHSESQGWVLVSSNEQTFELLDLKAKKSLALVAKTNVKADTYDQVWLHISKVMVTESGTAKEAKLPSNDVRISGIVKVAANATASATMDVIADESLHKTANGKFVFAPVIKFESRSQATVNVTADNVVTIVNGNVDSSKSAGMDVTGEVKDNFKLDAKAVIEINAGAVQIKGSSTDTINLK